MNRLISDLTILYTKLHTLHYNVVGTEFYSLHVMLEGEYDTVHGWIDEVAESMKMNGEYPIASVKEMLELTSISELTAKDYTGSEVISILLEDYKYLVKYIGEIKEEGTMVQENMLEEILTYLIKQIWFLEATAK